MSRPTIPRRLYLVPAVLAVALLAAAVGIQSVFGREPRDPIDELKARPTLEQITTHYEQIQQRVFDALSTELGPFTWESFRGGSGAGCGNDVPGDHEGQTASLPSWGFREAIPDEQWPRAMQIVADVTAEYGFDPPKILADRPGQHAIAGVGEYGAIFHFGGQINTSWQVATGCHFPARAVPLAADDVGRRPTLEDISTRYEQMQQRILDTVTAELGTLTWERLAGSSSTDCSPGWPRDAQTAQLGYWQSRAIPNDRFPRVAQSIPDDSWTRVTQIVADITAEYGFGPLSVYGGQDHIGYDSVGARYDLRRYQFGATWQLRTGCHFPAANHPTP